MDRGASRWKRVHKVQLNFSLLMSLLTIDRMCAKYGFEKPNDRRALDLMNTAAKAVVTELPEITIAYGVSDEYRFVRRTMSRLCITNTSNSFVFHKACTLFDRRARFVYTHSPHATSKTYHFLVNLLALSSRHSLQIMYTFGRLTSQTARYLLHYHPSMGGQCATLVFKISGIT